MRDLCLTCAQHLHDIFVIHWGAYLLTQFGFIAVAREVSATKAGRKVFDLALDLGLIYGIVDKFRIL